MGLNNKVKIEGVDAIVIGNYNVATGALTVIPSAMFKSNSTCEFCGNEDVLEYKELYIQKINEKKIPRFVTVCVECSRKNSVKKFVNFVDNLCIF